MSSCSSRTCSSQDDNIIEIDSSNSDASDHNKQSKTSPSIDAYPRNVTKRSCTGSHINPSSKRKSCKNQRVLYQKKAKYLPRNRNKYVDPAILINRLIKQKAKRKGTKATPVRVPQHVIDKIKADKAKKKKKPKETSQQRHNQKMALSEFIFKPLVQVNRTETPPRRTKHKDGRIGINKTAYLYPKRLSSNDPNAFVNKYSAELMFNITLYPKYKDIAVDEGKGYNMRDTKCFQLIDEWYIEERDQRTPFRRITDDYELITKWENEGLVVAHDAYKHRDRNIIENRNALKRFKCKIRKFCGGNADTQHHATTGLHYKFLNSKRLNGARCDPPSKVCIQCGLSLQCLPLLCIGEAVVFTKDKAIDITHSVYLYYVAMLCENYPICTFPRSRQNFDKDWIKCAWFNDINGKEYKENQENKKQKQQQSKKRKREETDINSLLSDIETASKKRRINIKQNEERNDIDIADDVPPDATPIDLTETEASNTDYEWDKGSVLALPDISEWMSPKNNNHNINNKGSVNDINIGNGLMLPDINTWFPNGNKSVVLPDINTWITKDNKNDVLSLPDINKYDTESSITPSPDTPQSKSMVYSPFY